MRTSSVFGLLICVLYGVMADPNKIPENPTFYRISTQILGVALLWQLLVKPDHRVHFLKNALAGGSDSGLRALVGPGFLTQRIFKEEPLLLDQLQRLLNFWRIAGRAGQFLMCRRKLLPRLFQFARTLVVSYIPG